MDSRLLATIIIFPIWLTLVLVFRRHRQWLLYYLVAAFGLTLQLVFLAEYFGIDQLLVNMASYHVDLISKYLLKMNLELLSNGRFQLIDPSTGGMDILKLGIECSAILESCIVLSLILFYPLFNWRQKILRASFGLVVTYVINLIRLIIIVLMADKFGSDYIFVAHAGIARVFFFICELVLYWYLMTKPTVKSVGNSILEKKPVSEETKVGRSLRMKHAIGQIIIILIVVGLSSVSFIVSKDWKKAFEGFARQERPVIYQEETGMEPTTGQVLGEMIVSNVLGYFEITKLEPDEEIIKNFPITTTQAVNLKISDGLEPLMIEVYLNDQFVNRSVVWPEPDRPLIERLAFERFIKSEINDYLTIKIRNLGAKKANYLIQIIKGGEDE